MASQQFMTNPMSIIDYSLVDGRVREFTLKGETLYDENRNIAVDGWLNKLIEFVKEWGLDVDEYLPAYILRLQKDGHLKSP